MESLGALGFHGAVRWEGESSREPEPDRIRGANKSEEAPPGKQDSVDFPLSGLSAHSSPLRESHWGQKALASVTSTPPSRRLALAKLPDPWGAER